MTRKTQRDNDALAIDRPHEFLRRERRVQQAGIVVLTLFSVAGLAGLFGNGPLADATITSGSTTLRFERFARHTFRTHLEISVTGADTPTVTVVLPRAFLDDIDLLEMRPPDTLTRLGETSATFEVPAGDGSATLMLHYEPKSYGILEADVVVAGQPPAHLRQIVFF